MNRRSPQNLQKLESVTTGEWKKIPEKQKRFVQISLNIYKKIPRTDKDERPLSANCLIFIYFSILYE